MGLQGFGIRGPYHGTVGSTVDPRSVSSLEFILIRSLAPGLLPRFARLMGLLELESLLSQRFRCPHKTTAEVVPSLEFVGVEARKVCLRILAFQT